MIYEDLGANPAQSVSERLSALARLLLNAESAYLWVAPSHAPVVDLPAASRRDGSVLTELCRRCALSGEPLLVADVGIELGNGLVDEANGSLDAAGAFLGVPCLGGRGQVLAVLGVLKSAAGAWSQPEVAVLQQLAVSAAAELELRASFLDSEMSGARAELVSAAAGIGTFDWNLRDGRLVWDDRLIEMFGYDRDTFDDHIDRFTERLHPDDEPRVRQAYDRAIETLGRYQAEYRVMLPSGLTRWVQAQGQVFGDASGRAVRLLGVALNVTEARTSEANLVQVLESMSSAFVALDHDWRLTYVNAEAERLLGRQRGELIGAIMWDLYPAALGSEIESTYREAVRTGQPAVLETYYPAPLNGWFEIRIWPNATGAALYFVETTERRAAQDLVRLSALVGERLAASLDLEAAVRDLAEVLVPMLADWSIVSVGNGAETLTDLASWHRDPALRPVVEQYAGSRLRAFGNGGLSREAYRTDEPVIVAHDATALALSWLADPEPIAAITQLQPESAVVLPLSVQGRVGGTLSLVRGADRPPMSPQELTAAISIARRAGMALENARLYAEQRATAERLNEANGRLQRIAEHDRVVAKALQAAMHTRLPEPDHLHIVARYRTAIETDQVGGDWYDAVLLPTGATTLVIGDVVGHDINAAAMMGQLRNLLRAFAWDHEEPPSAILTRLDRAMPDLGIDALATVVLALIEQTEAERLAGMRTLRWTNAGHPAPVLLYPDGHAEILDQSTDLLLGIRASTQRRDYTCPLPPDSTLLLYTDGLIETRIQDMQSGQRRLLAALSAHSALGLEDLLDAVLADLVGTRPDDDVAVLAVRFFDENRPRPPDAGPQKS